MGAQYFNFHYYSTEKGSYIAIEIIFFKKTFQTQTPFFYLCCLIDRTDSLNLKILISRNENNIII